MNNKRKFLMGSLFLGIFPFFKYFKRNNNFKINKFEIFLDDVKNKNKNIKKKKIIFTRPSI